jgi:2-dehydropantoate 2-reductase
VDLIEPLLADDGVVVGVQNGMTMHDIAAVVGPHRTLGAVIEMASNMFDPGIVNRQNAPADSGCSADDDDGALSHCSSSSLSAK